jgi:hypothetical protein
MHELITHYPGAPGSTRWWHLLDDAELAARQARRSELPERLLRWDAAPADADEVKEIRIIARDGAISGPPAWVAGLSQLKYLELPIRFVKALDAAAVPTSVEVLHVVGTGAAAAPKALVLPGVRFLLCNTGTLKFAPRNFPSLDRLSLGLDGPQKMLDVVAAYDGLRALHLSSVHADDLFGRISGPTLEYLGLVGGKLGSLHGIGALTGLRSLQLKNLAKLGDLAGIEALGALEELSIGYCGALTSVRELASLPRLRRLMLFGLGRVGIEEIRPALERKGLEQLSLGGAT